MSADSFRISKTKLDHVIEGIIRDVCELPDYNSPDDQPELLQATCSELEAILRNRLAGETGAEPTGTFECPVCGKAEPHQHPAHSIRWLSDHVQKFTDSISDPNVMPHYWSRQHAPDGDNVRFYAPPVQARWEAYCSAVKASETDLTLPQGDPQMSECQHDMSQQSPSELPVMRDRAQGVDCYWCEDGIPHRHEPSGPVCICPEAIDAATNPACPMHGFAVNGKGDA